MEGSQAADSHRIRDIAAQLTQQVSDGLFHRLPDGVTMHFKGIQGQVELALMRNGHHKIARAYVLYREEHARQLKVGEPFPGAQCALPWLDEQSNIRKEKNFFETRVTEYQTGGGLNWGA